MESIQFGIVGGGWRAEFFLRIARALPERFHVCGIVVRDADKGRVMEQKWGVATYRDIPSMLRSVHPSFVVSSVPSKANPEVVAQLAEAGAPVLSETPPAPDLPGLTQLYRRYGQARIQVAEQYGFQPYHAARLAVIRSGKLGTVHQVQISAAGSYHGISLLRLMLGAGFADATIHAHAIESPIVQGPNRQGPPQAEKLVLSKQTIAYFQFDGKWGVFDFAGDQYFSWIRSHRALVRGDRGEINQSTVRYLQDYATPVTMELRRLNAGEDGNLEGYYLRGIMAGEDWVYRNPYAPARLHDDELAIAACLDRMHAYVQGGPSFYNLADGCQDHYLSMLMNDAARTGCSLRSSAQIWAE